ncbi:MgtC/SapB family protein [Bacillus sp. SB49]|uniref:MgtC/SapB family protein n=1 Tax=Bacillus sp. SB49 TaxID=1071080 RepID=UPI0004247F0B|nr:MgtC/SapB family protein [Bacillus sp. SB49]QHT45134.1 MgtC/SapB family protein [Bacillus sp. SB49]
MHWSYFFHDDIVLIIFRLCFALVLSGLIGFEREIKNQSAGFRTHILVGVGACLMMLLSLYGFTEFMSLHEQVRFDPARIPSYVISGIGFLGAGTIMVNGLTIKGLTTAASIWTVAAIGLVVGAGLYDVATFTTLVVLTSLAFLNRMEKHKVRGKRKNSYSITVRGSARVHRVLSVFEEFQLTIQKVEVLSLPESQKKLLVEVSPSQSYDRTLVISRISEQEGVMKMTHYI